MEEKNNECTNNPLEVELQSACTCKNENRVEILGIPDEYFYNTCDCLNCDCTDDEEGENFCGCVGTLGDPLGMDYQSCICDELNVFN